MTSDWVKGVKTGSMGFRASGKGVPPHRGETKVLLLVGAGMTVVVVCEGEAQGLFEVEG